MVLSDIFYHSTFKLNTDYVDGMKLNMIFICIFYKFKIQNGFYCVYHKGISIK